MTRLRIVPLDDTVVFPGMPATLAVDVGDDERVLLVPRHDNIYTTVGVVAEVSERVRMAGRGFAVTLGFGIVTTVFTAFTLTRLIVATWWRLFQSKDKKLPLALQPLPPEVRSLEIGVSDAAYSHSS